jgi:hypothetical protein
MSPSAYTTRLVAAGLLALLPGTVPAGPVVPFDPVLDTLPGFTTFPPGRATLSGGDRTRVGLATRLAGFEAGLRFGTPPLPGTGRSFAVLSPASVGVAMAGFVGSVTGFTPYDVLRVVFGFDLALPVQPGSIIADPASGISLGLISPPAARPVPAPDPNAGSIGQAPAENVLPVGAFTPGGPVLARSSTGSTIGTQPSEAPGYSGPGGNAGRIVADLLPPEGGPFGGSTKPGTGPATGVAASPAPPPPPVPLPAPFWALMLGLGALARIARHGRTNSSLVRSDATCDAPSQSGHDQRKPVSSSRPLRLAS